jgi:hypothetical protein
MAADEPHRFDRRSSDANVAALALRVDSVERRVENMELQMRANTTELRANTELTRQIHVKTEEMHDAFAVAKGGFRTLEFIGRATKPLLYMAAALGAVVVGVKTGVWAWPFK